MVDAPALPPEVLAAARRTVALTLPGMAAVEVTKDLRYTDAEGDHLRLDVYRPPGLDARDRHPAVIFIHGGGPGGLPMKDMGAFTSYGRLAAAQGIVGVTFTHRLSWPVTRILDGAADVAAALAQVRANAAAWNIDADRLAIIAFSAGGPMLSPWLRDAPADVRALVAMYPVLEIEGSEAHRACETAETLAAWSPLAQLARPGRKPPLFLARAGGDAIPGLLAGLDAFVAEALAQDYPLTLINNSGAAHGFDIGEPTPRTLEVMTTMFGFLQSQLGVDAARASAGSV